MNVGEMVIKRRGELGLSRAELARRAEVDPKTIQGLEENRRWPHSSNRAVIERELGWEPGSLDDLKLGREIRPLRAAQLRHPMHAGTAAAERQREEDAAARQERDSRRAVEVDSRGVPIAELSAQLEEIRKSVRVIDSLPRAVQGVVLAQAREDLPLVIKALGPTRDRQLILYAFELLDEQEKQGRDAANSPRLTATPPILLGGNAESLAYVADSSPDEPEMGDDGYHDGP